MPHRSSVFMRKRCAGRLVALVVFLCIASAWWATPARAELRTLIIAAEGLADANAEAFAQNEPLLLEALRQDAKSQCVEKAVGALVAAPAMQEHYASLRASVLANPEAFITRVVKESKPWRGEDGFAHLLMQCEVAVTDVREALDAMARQERVALLREGGDPRISVAIWVRDADRGSDVEPMRSPIAENILKERIKGFGFRVWSEEHTTQLRAELTEKSSLDSHVQASVSIAQRKAADFFVAGEAKFKTLTARLPASGLEVSKYALTSWSVKVVNTHTGEEALYNTHVPKKQTWPDEDAALEEVGRLMGAELSGDLFRSETLAPSTIHQVEVLGLPGYDVGVELKREFLGLRAVLNADFREFDRDGLSTYEIEFAGSRGDFNDLLHTAVLSPLNAKLGERAFILDAAHGQTVRIVFDSAYEAGQLMERLRGLPPSSVTQAAPARLKDLIKSETTLQKVAEVTKQTPETLNATLVEGDAAQETVSSF